MSDYGSEMYFACDKQRRLTLDEQEHRTPFRRDYARLIHSPSFRRLQGKTQLFPSTENDFFRNRLTHSLEVAQIAKSIALRINSTTLAKEVKLHIDPDLIEFAALAHDLGHPPFGHQGEEALDECMIDNGGFEGNAQTLRILARLEKREFLRKELRETDGFNKQDIDERLGLNLTFRSLASVLKYDNYIPRRRTDRKLYHEQLREKGIVEGDEIKPVKGYYYTENEIVEEIKDHVTQGKWKERPPHFALEAERKYSKFKTIECKIMDLADDIAYSTYDLEDGLKAGFYNALDLLHLDGDSIKRVAQKVISAVRGELGTVDEKEILEQIIPTLKEIFKETFNGLDNLLTIEQGVGVAYHATKLLSSEGYNRTAFTASLVNDYIANVDIVRNGEIPALWDIKIERDKRLQIEILKRLTYEYQIKSPKLKIAEFRGKDIVKQVFTALDSERGHELLPLDFRSVFNHTVEHRKRVICDFIAGMTDRYLIEFYSRLYSEDPETIFKPI